MPRYPASLRYQLMQGADLRHPAQAVALSRRIEGGGWALILSFENDSEPYYGFENDFAYNGRQEKIFT
jgi:hypothetical protein